MIAAVESMQDTVFTAATALLIAGGLGLAALIGRFRR